MSTHNAGIKRRQAITLPNGRTIEISALGLRDWIELRERALYEYRRDLMAAVEAMKDFCTDEEYQQHRYEAIIKGKKASIDNIPQKTTSVLVDSDNGKTDGKVVEVLVDYDGWWMSKTPSGWLYSIWLGARACDASKTLEDIDEMFRNNVVALEEAADVVGDLTRPHLLPDSENDVEESGESNSGNLRQKRQKRQKEREARNKRREKRQRTKIQQKKN